MEGKSPTASRRFRSDSHDESSLALPLESCIAHPHRPKKKNTRISTRITTEGKMGAAYERSALPPCCLAGRRRRRRPCRRPRSRRARSAGTHTAACRLRLLHSTTQTATARQTLTRNPQIYQTAEVGSQNFRGRGKWF